MAAVRIGRGALIAAGAWAGPVAGGQLILLAKPLGGVLGVPGAVVGYIALTALVIGCATGALAAWRAPSPRVSGGGAMVGGAAFAVAGMVTGPVLFVAATLIAAAACGPLIVTARTFAWRNRVALNGWHVAQAVGVVLAAGTAAWSEGSPGTALVVTGIVLVVLGMVGLWAEPSAAPRDSTAPTDHAERRRVLLGYAVVGLVLGGTVLPTLHLLLFRWNALADEQATLLMFAAIPAVLAVALPGPRADAIPVLALLVAGGPVLVATAPGTETAAIGLAVTLTAAARAGRGLDLVAAGDRVRRRDAAPSTTSGARSRTPGPITTLATAVVAAGAGLALVSLGDELFGTATALTLLAFPVGVAARYAGRAALTSAVRSPVAGPILEGGTP